MSDKREKLGTVMAYPNGVWDKAKEETRQLLIEEARAQSVIAYSILAAKVQTVPFSERSQLFFEILTEISREEDAAGRGLLSVVVVHKTEDFPPGPGFFNLARSLGRGSKDSDGCWVEELRKVHSYWSNHAPTG